MKDFESDEMGKRSWINEKIIEILRRFGFRLVEPSKIENLDTLEAKSGPDIRNEIYCFKDKAGRDLGLRFDLTVGMTRMVANRLDLTEPMKICTISDMWRYDEPQFGRYRHFYQWDAEIFGSSEPEADAEIIWLSTEILENVGLREYEVRVSNRRLVEGLLRGMGIMDSEALERTIRIMDKSRKISTDEMRSELGKMGICGERSEKILDLATIRGKLDNVVSEIPGRLFQEDMADRGLKEVTSLFDTLEAFKQIDRCVLDLGVVRGIGYYDGIVFEAYDKGCEDIGAIFGGGRYDGLCRIYGKRDMPATGVAGGIERLMMSLERASLFPKARTVPTGYVVSVDDSARQRSWEIAHYLRGKGICVDFDLKRRSLKKQLEFVDSVGIPFAIIVGSRETARGTVMLRNMRKRQEQEIGVEELPNRLVKGTLQS